jgi:hypothetical protein
MRTRLLSLLALTTALVAATSVTPALAEGPPRTLAAERRLGALSSASAVVTPGFPVDYLGVSWSGPAQLSVRLHTDGGWTRWFEVEGDGDLVRGRSFSELVDGADAGAYQLRGAGRDVRVVAINTTDGPRLRTLRPVAARAELAQPGVVSRADWGADESLRFTAEGAETWTPTFFPTQKLVVHHTATKNDDPDPEATIRAIYRYHAVDKGWGDIGYNFLVDAQGRIYKGRWSGPADSLTGDTPTGENAEGHGVTGAHVGGYNSGTMGIAVLGDYDKGVSPSAASLDALVAHLAWEAQHHGLDPEGSSLYVNPVNGAQKDAANISAHRDWSSTACPGRHLYAELPGIRTEAAAVIAADGAATTDPGAGTTSAEQVDAITVDKGSTSETTTTDLDSDDMVTTYDVSSARQGRTHVTQWTARIDLAEPAAVTGLTVVLDGHASATVTRVLSVYDPSAGSWRDVRTATVSGEDVTSSWTADDVQQVVSSSGAVLLRVRTSGSTRATTATDLLHAEVTRTS